MGNLNIFVLRRMHRNIVDTYSTQVRITLPDGEVTWTLFGVTLCFTSTTRESIVTITGTLTKLLTKVIQYNTLTFIVACSSC